MYSYSPTCQGPLPDCETGTFGIETTASGEVSDASSLARQLSGLGYPGFAHLRAEQTNPVALVLQSLVQRDLEVRLSEALPWVLGTYPSSPVDFR
jgi:hypothetical protein